MRSPFSAPLLLLFTGGACGSTPPPVVPKPDGPSPALTDIARQCARIASCSDTHDSMHMRNPTSCVDWWLVSTQAEPESFECLSKAKTCKELQSCTHEPKDTGAIAFCAAHPGALGVCDGTKLYTCSDATEESSAMDCASLGGTCIEQRVSGGLVVRGCTSPKLCPQHAPASRCEVNAVVRCEDGLAEKRDCPQSTKCAMKDGEASCEGEPLRDRSQRCSKPGFAACDGDRVSFCTLVGREAWLRTTDCTKWGMTCGMHDGRANCIIRGGVCAGNEARCDGDTLVFCAAGTEMRASCKDLGLSKCDPAARAQEAACR